MKSPYENVDSSKWLEITQQLLNDFPLSNKISFSFENPNVILSIKSKGN